VLMGLVAAATTTIRVGAGGILLPNHVPLVVAEQAGTLEAAFPGRIDLGLGRSAGATEAVARALHRKFGPEQTGFRQDVEELETARWPRCPARAGGFRSGSWDRARRARRWPRTWACLTRSRGIWDPRRSLRLRPSTGTASALPSGCGSPGSW
jgi:alkanesulfonate monooxygenase SsuD/methylene tetrahydromethanopterin reductase-like flavin-dependent oxidoreductase (luciferase family)